MIWPLLISQVSSLSFADLVLHSPAIWNCLNSSKRAQALSGSLTTFHFLNSYSSLRKTLRWYLRQGVFPGFQSCNRNFISVSSEYLIVTSIRNHITLHYNHLFLGRDCVLITIGNLLMFHIYWCFLKERITWNILDKILLVDSYPYDCPGHRSDSPSTGLTHAAAEG